MTFELDGQPFTLHEQPITALAQIAAIRGGLPTVSGYVVATADFPPPYALGLVVGDKITEIGAVDGTVTEDDRLEFTVIGRPSWPPAVPKRVTPQLGLMTADGRWAPLPVASGQAHLALDYLDERLFTRYVIPTRIKTDSWGDSQKRRSVHQFLHWESNLGSWGWRRRSR